MGQCKCYETRLEPIETNSIFRHTYGVCLSTKEIDRCNCGGDESKCDFYPEKRKAAEKKMNTAEMWLKAQEDGKTYYSKKADALYSKEFGLVEEEDINQKVSMDDFPTFEHLMQSEWEEVKVMSKAEAEKKYGIKIVNLYEDV